MVQVNESAEILVSFPRRWKERETETWGCLNLCPPFNPHLVTAACDTVLKSRSFTAHHLVYVASVHNSRHPFTPHPSLSCSETVPASLWRLGLDSRGLGSSLTDCSPASYRPDITCSERDPYEAIVRALLCILLVSILLTGGEFTEWCNPKV